jgi:hypothetical protein
MEIRADEVKFGKTIKLDAGQLQEFFDKLEAMDQEKFINRNLCYAGEDEIEEAYIDNQVDSPDEKEEEDDYIDRCSSEELFEELQHILSNFNHTSYKKVPLSKDKAMKIVEDMYNWMNIK